MVPTETIARSILLVRGQKVLLDADLARLYGVETRALNQAVRRNQARFPEDFMFQLSSDEQDSLRSQTVILDSGRGRHRKFAPLAFTEQGVAMLSSVLRSPRAVAVNIEIMRTFVELRRVIDSTAGLSKRLDALERRYDSQFKRRLRCHQAADDPVAGLAQEDRVQETLARSSLLNIVSRRWHRRLDDPQYALGRNCARRCRPRDRRASGLGLRSRRRGVMKSNDAFMTLKAAKTIPWEEARQTIFGSDPDGGEHD